MHWFEFAIQKYKLNLEPSSAVQALDVFDGRDDCIHFLVGEELNSAEFDSVVDAHEERDLVDFHNVT